MKYVTVTLYGITQRVPEADVSLYKRAGYSVVGDKPPAPTQTPPPAPANPPVELEPDPEPDPEPEAPKGKGKK